MALQESELQRAAWNNRAPDYLNNWERKGEEADMIKQQIEDMLVKHGVFHEGSSVLDVACGKGTLLPFMKKLMNGKGRIVELDISDVMLSYARQRADDLEMQEQVQFFQADGSETGFDPQSFDTIIVFNAFPHFSDKSKFIQECANLLHPGGSLIIAHNMSRDQLNAMHARKGFDTTLDALPSQNEMMHLLHDAGFVLSDYVDDSRTTDYFLVKAQLQEPMAA